MKTIAALALLAVANAVRIQDSNVPWRSDFPNAEECEWLENGRDGTNIPEGFEARRPFWDLSQYYCEHENAIACWEKTPAGDNVSSYETQACLTEVFGQ